MNSLNNTRIKVFAIITYNYQFTFRNRNQISYYDYGNYIAAFSFSKNQNKLTEDDRLYFGYHNF